MTGPQPGLDLDGGDERTSGSLAALRASEALLRTFIRESRDGIVIVDRQGIVLEWNEGEVEITGIPRAEALGRPIWDVQQRVLPAERRTPAAIRAAKDKVLAGLAEGTLLERTLEDEIERPDGARRIVQTKIFAIRSEGDLLACGISRDITRGKQLEQALRESEQRFRTMADSAPVMIWVTDREGHNHFVNQAYREFFGKTAQEVEGSAWRGLVHPDDVDAYVEAFHTAMRRRGPLHQEIRVRRRDGEWRWVESLGAPRLSPEGELLGMVGTAVDVTARRQADEELRRSREDLRRAQAVAHVGSWRINVEGSVLEWSEETYRMFGIAPGTPMTYQAFLSCVHPDDRAHVDASWRAALEGQPYDIEHRIVVGDEVKWVREVAHLEFDRDGALRGGFGTVQDITDRKAMEQAVAELGRRKDEFLAVLSHELRNPLAPVRSSLYVLARVEPGGEQARRMLEIIERQVGHLTRLVDDLLDVTRISRGKVQLQRAHTDLGELVRRTIEDHRAAFSAKRVRLAGRIPPEPMRLFVDPTRIAQVIGNLLTNAAKFTPSGGRVEVVLEQEGAHALVRVRDSGVGIAAGLRERMFEPFMQGEIGRSGLGLGLALVKSLTELHGGTVEVHSDGPGKGAEFSVRLPMRAMVAAPVAAGKALRIRRRRVLVIEDNVDGAGALKEALELDGHEVQVAYHGAEGLAVAASFRPEVVLCDIGLPGMDGYQVASALRADPALGGVFLVALTGYALPEDLLRARRAGFQRHLAKPSSFEKLRELLAEAP